MQLVSFNSRNNRASFIDYQNTVSIYAWLAP